MFLTGADRSFNAVVIGGALHRLARLGWSLAECEGMLRDLQSNTYLVAWHKDKMPPYMQARTVYGSKCDYAVWICLYGSEERDQTIRRFGLSGIEDNLKHLAKAGFVSAAAN